MELVIIGVISPVVTGQVVALDDWPVHMTLLQWFQYDGDTEELISGIVSAIAPLVPFTLTVGGERQFSSTVTVNVVEDSKEITKIHQSLLSVATDLGCQPKNAQWVGEGFIPHITHYPSGSRQTGEQISVKSYAIAKKISKTHREIIFVSS